MGEKFHNLLGDGGKKKEKFCILRNNERADYKFENV
jgi:hypothetical protein